MTREEQKWLLQTYPALFESTVERLLNSPNKDERELILLGFLADSGRPVLVPREMWFRGMWGLGDPGSGKSARGIAPVMSQMIAGGDVSVVILDLKEDMGLFHNAKAEAERAGLPFQWLTNRIGSSSHVWNIFAEPFLRQWMTVEQQAQLLLMATGTDSGEGYGKGFFSSGMRQFLANILQKYAESIHSLKDLYRYVADPNAYKGLGPQDDWKNAQHFTAVLRMPAGVAPLVATATSLPPNSHALRNAISVERILAQPGVVYLSLPSTVDSNQATCIARLFLYALMTAASIYQRKRRQVPVFVTADEAQQIATQGLPLLLNQCRAFQIGLSLFHQSIDQLKLNSDVDLTHVVQSSTGIKQVFRASDMLIRDFITKTGGEALYHKLGWTQAAPLRHGQPVAGALRPAAARDIDFWSGDPLVHVQEEIRPRMEPNTIMQVSADPALSLVNFTGDEGPVQYGAGWNIVISGFHIDSKTYRDRMQTPWPAVSAADGTILVTRGDRPSDPPPVPAPVPPSGPGGLDERVRNALQRLKQQSR